jgi:DeoR/GlpR family transcriptional regulator of sugar metabolism
MTNTNSEIIKKKIIKTVESHPEGLTIQDLSKILRTHRQTITKYILFLEGAGTIHRRRIGSATLHYTKKQYEKYHTIRNRRI